MVKRIGGVLDYARMKQLHKPPDQAAITSEVHRLSDEGLKPRDIAASLGVHIEIVLRALSVTQEHRK